MAGSKVRCGSGNRTSTAATRGARGPPDENRRESARSRSIWAYLNQPRPVEPQRHGDTEKPRFRRIELCASVPLWFSDYRPESAVRGAHLCFPSADSEKDRALSVPFVASRDDFPGRKKARPPSPSLRRTGKTQKQYRLFCAFLWQFRFGGLWLRPPGCDVLISVWILHLCDDFTRPV